MHEEGYPLELFESMPWILVYIRLLKAVADQIVITKIVITVFYIGVLYRAGGLGDVCSFWCCVVCHVLQSLSVSPRAFTMHLQEYCWFLWPLQRVGKVLLSSLRLLPSKKGKKSNALCVHISAWQEEQKVLRWRCMMLLNTWSFRCYWFYRIRRNCDNSWNL